MNRKRIRPTTYVIYLLIFLSLMSCATKKPLTTQPSTISTSIADVTVRITYLDRDTLLELYGSNLRWKQNPYVDYPGMVPKRNIIVLDTQFSTMESNLDVEIRNIRLEIEGESGRAVSIQYLRNLWIGYKDDVGWPRIERATRENMFSESFSVTPEESKSGYLVFPHPYGFEGGTGVINIGMRTQEGDEGFLEIPVRFTEEGIQHLSEQESTGIFADSD